MNNRITGIKIFILLFFLILIIRAGQLQLVQGNYYYQLSEGNRISLRPISAPRGKIIDNQGNILVSNRLSYNLYLLPNEVSPDIAIEGLLRKLSQMTALDYSIISKNLEDQGDPNSLSAILLKRNIPLEIKVIVEENSEELPGLMVKDSSIRDYVFADLAPHILGYIGEIGPEDLQVFSQQGHSYQGGDIIGITGLEREYEFFLKGTDGIERVEVNSRGEKVRSLGIKPPVAGNNLVLTIDIELQRYVENLLQEQFRYLREYAKQDPELHTPEGVAAIVMDPNSGAILAMASIPGFDLNDFAGGISNQKYNELLNNPMKPLWNDPIKAEVPPGSIFKLVTGTAAIEYLGVNADTEFIDNNGEFHLPNWSRPYKNWKETGEGKLSFVKSIARSNNIVFYSLGYRLYLKFRGEKLAETAREYGLGSKTGIDLPGEEEGLVPDGEWKKEVMGEGWYPGDSVNLSIGQGQLQTTPIQLIDMVSAIANGGKLYKPFLVDKVLNDEGQAVIDNKPTLRNVLPFKDRTLKTLRQGMHQVTDANYGTASRYFEDFPIPVAGKTGTAQTGTSRPNHGFFAGFAPFDDPQVAVLVFLEKGNSSRYTLPIAVNIFSKYFGLGKQGNVEESNQEVNKEVVNEETEQTEPLNQQNKLFEFLKEVFSNEE